MPLTRDELVEAYRAHRKMMVRRATSIVGAEAAEDVAQEIMAELLAKPESFAGRAQLTTFLYAMVTHRCLTRLRNDKTRARLLAAEGAVVDDEARASDADKLIFLRQLLARMPDELATVAVYHHVDSLSQDEIAEVMSCSRRHVSDLLGRFRAAALALVAGDAS